MKRILLTMLAGLLLSGAAMAQDNVNIDSLMQSDADRIGYFAGNWVDGAGFGGEAGLYFPLTDYWYVGGQFGAGDSLASWSLRTAVLLRSGSDAHIGFLIAGGSMGAPQTEDYDIMWVAQAATGAFLGVRLHFVEGFTETPTYLDFAWEWMTPIEDGPIDAKHKLTGGILFEF